METTINEALAILNEHDWYWSMLDYGYSANEKAAKASMRSFVAKVNEITNKGVREALRELWINKYEESVASIIGNSTKGFKAAQNALMNIINA